MLQNASGQFPVKSDPLELNYDSEILETQLGVCEKKLLTVTVAPRYGFTFEADLVHLQEEAENSLYIFLKISLSNQMRPTEIEIKLVAHMGVTCMNRTQHLFAVRQECWSQ